MRRAGALACVVAAAGLAGCSSSHHGAASSPSTTATSPSSTTAAPTSTVPATSTPQSTTTTSAGPGPGCTLSELNITSPGTQGAAGHQAAVIVFQNRGSRTCILSGYPGVAALDPSGRVAANAQRTPTGFVGGLGSSSESPPVLHLAPSDEASATVEGTSVPVGGATSCPTYSALEVTPPGETHSVRLNVGLPGCSPLQVHPVVAGTSGPERHGPAGRVWVRA